MVTYAEISTMLLSRAVDDMFQNKGREYRLIDIMSKLEENVKLQGKMIMLDTYADIYLALRTAYEAGIEARMAAEKDQHG